MARSQQRQRRFIATNPENRDDDAMIATCARQYHQNTAIQSLFVNECHKRIPAPVIWKLCSRSCARLKLWAEAHQEAASSRY